MAILNSDSGARISFDASSVRSLGGELNLLVDQVELSLAEHRMVAPVVAEQIHALRAAAERLFAEEFILID